MEFPRMQLLRGEYLTKLKTFREENRFICYWDKTWYDNYEIVKKVWSDESEMCQIDVPVSIGKHIIIAHAGSGSAWISEPPLSAKDIKSSCVVYHENITANLFENWVTNKLLPFLLRASVTIIENASYRSRQHNESTIRRFTK